MSDSTPLTPGHEAPAAAADNRPSDTTASRSSAPSAADRLQHAQAMNRGYGVAMGRGIELAATLAVMVGVGWLIDRMAGTAPVFIIIFSVLGFAGTTVKLFLGYDLEMSKHEDGAIWNRKAGDVT